MTCGCSSNWGISQTKWGCWDKCISIDPKSGSQLFVPTEGRASASLNRTKFMGLLSPWQSQAARFASDSPWFSPWFTPLHSRLPSFHCKAQEPHRKSGEWIPNCPGPFEMKEREALWICDSLVQHIKSPRKPWEQSMVCRSWPDRIDSLPTGSQEVGNQETASGKTYPGVSQNLWKNSTYPISRISIWKKLAMKQSISHLHHEACHKFTAGFIPMVFVQLPEIGPGCPGRLGSLPRPRDLAGPHQHLRI